MFEREAHADANDFFVRASEGHMQEAEGIEQGLRCVPESFQHRLLGDLGRFRAVRMAAHSVDDDKQSRVLGHRRDDAVLVFFARSEQ
jgi:hypothetical protein